VISTIAREGGHLSDAEIRTFVDDAFKRLDIDGRRVIFIIPDNTRSMPMSILFRTLYDVVHERVATMDFLVALGTHPPMSDEALNGMLGITAEERDGKYRDIGVFNHDWQNLDALDRIGTITEDEIGELSDGLLHEKVDVTINSRILDYNQICIVGPVFPHEVVGFSGGNKYFYPGVSGAEILNLLHWLGALITNQKINGAKHTPVRGVIDKAASFIDIPKACFCLNVFDKTKCRGIFFGTPEEAWSPAADLAAETHIVYKDRRYESILAAAPAMYDEIWVAAKCMYKLEPVVADGGELIIYAPHITEVSVVHGDLIRRIGYHTRDYFLAQMDRFTDIPGGVLAHSTHVRGVGTYENGVEKPRIRVTLATGIAQEECEAINLGYRDPATVNPDDWKDKEDEGLLLVPNAGEVLYRLKNV